MHEKLPRILLLANNRDWAFDFSAQQIRRHLANEFEIDIEYIRDKPFIDPIRYKLVFIFFWGESYYRRFDIDPRRIIKNVSSHRWEDNPKYGPCDPDAFVQRYLSDAAAVSCTSLRLLRAIQGLHPHVYHAPNGYDSGKFFNKQKRNGPLTIGWAGAPQDTVKGYHDIIQPACENRFELRLAGGKLQHGEMNDFYNDVDILAVSSKHEGEPLPLIEAMAAGCFPVCTDVGIVPELVQSGVNGLIVNRSPEDFEEAFSWCGSNLDFIRRAGRGNAEKMLRQRTWPTCIPYFRRLFTETLERTKP